MTRAFPDDFRWGTATAAHQIEGGNVNNDWWAWEHATGTPVAEPSGDACDSWERWPEDVALCERIGVDNYRFSLEWSRIEPEPGAWSSSAVDHYRRICDALLAAGIDPVVTFHHFTSPRWIAERGGWAEAETANRFAEFCARASQELADGLRVACTVNEPNVVSFMGYGFGMFPPGGTDMGRVADVNTVFIDAHRKAVEAIRSGAPGVPVGLTLSMTDMQAVDGGERHRDDARALMEDRFLEASVGDDFIGVQTYSRQVFGPDGVTWPDDDREVLALGYEYYPEALGSCIRRAWEVTDGQVPIRVTENGIGTADDEQRIAYVTTALDGVLDCLADGIDVTGYTLWSLLDNFEWAFGYGPHFGLVEVERAAPFTRTPKPSAAFYADIIARNALPARS